MRVPFASSVLGRFFPSVRMRRDWDLRARENARHYIDCGHGSSDEEFWRSGREDLDNYILRDIELDSSAAALEIGCGIGRLVRPLSARVAEVTGVDISGEMIRQGQEALRDLPNAQLHRTDGDLSAVADASLDLVFSHIVFQHIPARKAVTRYFEEAARVLRGGGIFRFQIDGRPPRLGIPDTWNGVRFTGAAVRRELAAAGFEVLDLTGEGTQYMWVTARRRDATGREPGSPVRFRPPAWDAQALDALLERMGCPAGIERQRLLSGAVTLRELSEPLIARYRNEPPREYVARLYRILLGREPDDGGLAFYAGEIEQGIARTNVVDCLLASAEFDTKHRSRAPSGLNASFTPPVRT
jgi:SAM-dependent methyltransferase